jgi:hypothetical protein
MNRKYFLKTIVVAPWMLNLRLGAATPQITVFKAQTCSCCGKWAEQLRNNGFDVKIQEVPSTADYRRKFGVPDALASCHTAIVDGYAIEGHVPAADIQRLLRNTRRRRGWLCPECR